MNTVQKPRRRVRKTHVADIMTTDIVSVRPGDTVYEALELMLENHVSALPVINGRGRCVGVISATDVLNLTQDVENELIGLREAENLTHYRAVERLANSEMAAESVQAAMTRDVIRVGPSATIAKAAALMVRHHVHRLLVVDDERRLVGIVSTMDVMRALARKNR
jgi:CBS domain-containing protein